MPETFTPEERRRLDPHFSTLDGHVFALTNLPETVKGALFARYSRSAKPLRRLFLDEFADRVGGTGAGAGPSDAVAQLGGAHVACEYVSNVLTKVLEWGRLMSYLEQSTRYVPYTDRLDGRWRYHVPEEVGGGPLRELVGDELGGRHAAERREPLEELAAELARSRARELAIDMVD